MDFLNIIATLRKFGNFLAGLFPALGTLGNRIFEILKLKQINEFYDKQKNKPPFSAIAPIIDRFLWKDYAKDRLEIANLAPEMVPILKLIALLSVFLVFLMPLCAVFNFGSVKITLNNGTVSSAPAWSIWCWIIISALSWACLTTGAAISNRLGLIVISLSCVYYLGSCALFLPRSYWNSFLSITVLLGIMISAKVLPTKSIKDKISAAAASIISGAPTGLVLTALTPVHHYVKPFVLQWGGTIGSLLGLFSIGTAYEKKSDTQPLRLFISLVTISAFIFLSSLVVRGGLSPVGDQLLSSIRLWNGYLWPIWYYIGVGIIFKLLKNARIISKAVQDLMPKRTFVPLALLAVASGLVVFWSPILSLAFFPPHPLAPVSALFIPVYKYYRSVLNDPTNIYTSEWMRWILGIDLFVIFWMIAKRKLTNENVGSLAYMTLLCWFFIAEYTFQISSFSHAPRHSELLVTLFAVWLLWLFHTSILGICSESSRLWPAQGRQLLYSGFVCLCLLEIAARTTVQDYSVSNEIFLMMFRGIIDVGIPYFLFVFATRKLTTLPITTLRLFQALCLGAVFTIPMNILDKFAMTRGSVSSFMNLWKSEIELYGATGVISTAVPHLPVEWLLVRSLLFTAALALLSASIRYVRKRQWIQRGLQKTQEDNEQLPKGTYATCVFLLISFAGGFASFSKTAVDLPLPTEWKVLISPFSMNVYLDYYWLVAYLSAWLSTMVFLLFLPLRTKGIKRSLQLLSALLSAIVFTFAIQWIYPGKEHELNSANILPLVSVAGVSAFLYLAFLVWTKVQRDLECTETAPEKQQSKPLFSKLELSTIAAVILIIFAFVIGSSFNSSRMTPRPIRASNNKLDLPAHWMPIENGSNAKDTTNHFYALGETDLKSFMDVGLLPSNNSSLKETFQDLAEKISKGHTLKDFELKKLEVWNENGKDAVTGYFTYSQLFDKSPMQMIGVTSLLRRTNKDKIQFVTIYCFPSELQRRLSDLRRIVASF